jgi:hypothetical protein
MAHSVPAKDQNHSISATPSFKNWVGEVLMVCGWRDRHENSFIGNYRFRLIVPAGDERKKKDEAKKQFSSLRKNSILQAIARSVSDAAISQCSILS